MLNENTTRRPTVEGALAPEVVTALQGRESKRFPRCDLRAYYSAGRSYLVPTAGIQGDRLRDLAPILPAPQGGSHVAQLRAIFDEEMAA